MHRDGSIWAGTLGDGIYCYDGELWTKLEHESGSYVVPTLERHFQRLYDQSGLRVAFEHEGIEQRFAPEVESTVFRLVQESLTNVVRHAEVKEATVQV